MSQSPKPPNPFDPVEEKHNPLPDTVQEALESFERLNKGGAAPSVVVETDGNHSSAQWETPKKP